MTEPQDISASGNVVPETPTELAKRLWDTAIQHLEYASNSEDVLASDSYTRIGELALKAAQFALANQALMAGISALPPGLPSNAPPLPSHLPKVWGSTS